MKVQAKPSTAKHGSPADASRGAAVTLAKSELSDAFDRLLELEIVSQEQWKLLALAELIGVSVEVARQRLDLATLGELHGWRAAVETKAGELR